MARQNKTNVNKAIRAKEVRVIDPEGNQLGVLALHQAIATANDFALDLVEISPNASPPVCKIMDYGRFKYEQTKKAQEAKKKQNVFQIKEIKFRPKTEEHDFQTKLNHIRKFLGKKDKVKVTMLFRGREIMLSQAGRELLERVITEIEDVAVVELRPKFEGRTMVMVLSPK
ncbi:MAG: translation initiation factor IF-3 [Proteobacteria bacterium]|nr:translation initiation factor IF-3 [Pseudomonadota bacterium]